MGFILTYERAPPPSHSKPEASNFPNTQYGMSNDASQFRAPSSYPEPPTGMWYNVPSGPKYQRPAPIFPWEKDAPEPSRVFAEDYVDNTVPAPKSPDSAVATSEETNDPVTLTTPTTQSTDADDPWQNYSQSNAWDNVPEIEKYVGNLTKKRQGNVQVLQGSSPGINQISSPGERRGSLILTNFPTATERPSLPVTPAPIRRPVLWGEERSEQSGLPAAQGVPAQEDWVRLFDEIKGSLDAFKSLFEDPRSRLAAGIGPVNLFYDLTRLLKDFKTLHDDLLFTFQFFTLTPSAQDPAAQLEMLARRQSDVLASKLNLPDREIPSRSLPYGSEGFIASSPTVAGVTNTSKE